MERGLVDLLISTGANLYHDLHYALNFNKPDLRKPNRFAPSLAPESLRDALGRGMKQNIDERLRHETQMPVHLAESPLTCVAVGSGRSLEEFEAIHRSQAQKRRNNHRP